MAGLNDGGFESDFLDNYLSFGLGSMTKTDIDALVMALLDKYGMAGLKPLSHLSNQAASEVLKTSVSRVKKLRYDAALKFGGPVEEQAKGRLLAALANSTIAPEGDKICLIIEDTLAKNWLQGQLKANQTIFDHPFNSELIRVSSEGLFEVLSSLFDKSDITTFRDGYEAARKTENAAARKELFWEVARNFANGAAGAAGGSVLKVMLSQLGLAIL